MAEAGTITQDTLLRGRVKLLQPVRGFRSSLDPVLLAGFVGRPVGHFMDVGMGTGALSFLLLARDPRATGVGLEIQPRLARLARDGVALNGFQTRFRVVEHDARVLAPEVTTGPFDLVVTNPPFRPLGGGLLPADPERTIAHHEVLMKPRDWVSLTATALAGMGRLAVIFPAERERELERELRTGGFHIARRRFVHARRDAPALRVLLEARRRAGLSAGPATSVCAEAPLVLHEGGTFTPEVLDLLHDLP